MAYFCSICANHLFDPNTVSGDNIVIEDEFKKIIDYGIQKFLNKKNLIYYIDKIYCEHFCCEHCGLMALSIEKENKILYLIAHCMKKGSNNTGYYIDGYKCFFNKYRIATIDKNNNLEYIEEGIRELYNDK